MTKKSRDRRVARRKEAEINYKVDTDNYNGGKVWVKDVDKKVKGMPQPEDAMTPEEFNVAVLYYHPANGLNPLKKKQP